jgi:hypothetical protein
MPVSNIVLDGTMAYGSRTVTCSNGVTYVANNIQITRGKDEVVDTGVTGIPTRARATETLATISCELQLEAANTAYPKFGQTFSATFDANYGSETFRIDPVNHTETREAGDIRVLNITGVKTIGTITTVG